MKTFIISIVSTAVLIAISELILPQGRLKSVVNTIFSLALLIVVISPLKNENEDYIPTFKSEGSKTQNELSYVNEYFDSKAESYYSMHYKKALLDNDLIAEKIIVEISNMQIEKIKIFLSNLVIPEENSHINNNVISLYVAKILEVDAKKVEIYA